VIAPPRAKQELNGHRHWKLGCDTEAAVCPVVGAREISSGALKDGGVRDEAAGRPQGELDDLGIH